MPVRSPAYTTVRALTRRGLLPSRSAPLDQVLVAELVHDDPAGIDAPGAGDALQLKSVPDVDPLRADEDALVALDAATCLLHVRTAPGFPTRHAVLHHQGLAIRQRALKPGVRAEVIAELLPEPGEVEEPDRGEDPHNGIFKHAAPAAPQLASAGEVAAERHRDDQRNG